MSKIKIAVIGVGRMGTFHARKVSLHEEAELTGVFDIDKDKREQLAQELNVKAYSSIEDAIADSEAVVLSAATTAHAEIGMKVLEGGCNMLVEKPIAATIDGARKIVETAKKKGLTVGVGHIENFNPAFMASLEYVKNPIFIEAHRLSQFVGRGTDVSVVMDLMIHDIEMLLRLMGDVKEVKSSGADVLTGNIDIASARLAFNNGVANVTASRISDRNMRKMRIFCKGGYISIDFGAKKSEAYFSEDYDNIPEGAIPFKLGENVFYKFDIPVVDKDQLHEQLTDFIHAVKENKTPFVTAEQGLRALEVSEQVLNKAENN